MRAFRDGHGAAFNDAFCGFPGDDDDEVIDGIEFAIKGKVVVISYENFYRSLCEVCKAFVDQHPGQEEEVARLLVGIRDKLSSL